MSHKERWIAISSRGFSRREVVRGLLGAFTGGVLTHCLLLSDNGHCPVSLQPGVVHPPKLSPEGVPVNGIDAIVTALANARGVLQNGWAQQVDPSKLVKQVQEALREQLIQISAMNTILPVMAQLADTWRAYQDVVDMLLEQVASLKPVPVNAGIPSAVSPVASPGSELPGGSADQPGSGIPATLGPAGVDQMSPASGGAPFSGL